MVLVFTKAPISRAEEVRKMTKFSIFYIRVSTKRQIKVEASGINRKEEEYQRWFINSQNTEIRWSGI